MSEPVHSGSCLCGRISFKARGKLREVIACHCGQCRKQTGLYYAATNVRHDHLELNDWSLVSWYQSSEKAKRGFCGSCGSALFWAYDGEAEISVMAGAFDAPTDLKMGYHIFCADKGDFYEITDGLPRYDKGSPGLVVAEV
jgi:hypothetical protein